MPAGYLGNAKRPENVAADGSTMTPEMVAERRNYYKDMASGYIDQSGNVLPSMNDHADALHPVPKR